MAESDTRFDEFFAAEFTRLVALGAFLTHDRAAGEDLAQDAMRIVAAEWVSIRGFDNPLGYARRVVINLASNERRRRQRESIATEKVARTTTLAHHDDASWIQQDPELWAAVAALPTNQRAAIALRYLDDLDTAEIADALDCAPSTVRVHLHRAHTTLAQQLAMTTREEYPHD